MKNGLMTDDLCGRASARGVNKSAIVRMMECDSHHPMSSLGSSIVIVTCESSASAQLICHADQMFKASSKQIDDSTNGWWVYPGFDIHTT